MKMCFVETVARLVFKFFDWSKKALFLGTARLYSTFLTESKAFWNIKFWSQNFLGTLSDLVTLLVLDCMHITPEYLSAANLQCRKVLGTR